jgi:hypothetical protein
MSSNILTSNEVENAKFMSQKLRLQALVHINILKFPNYSVYTS